MFNVKVTTASGVSDNESLLATISAPTCLIYNKRFMKRFIFLSASIFRGEKHFNKAKNEALISKLHQSVRSEYIIVGFLRPQSLKITLLYLWWGRGP